MAGISNMFIFSDAGTAVSRHGSGYFQDHVVTGYTLSQSIDLCSPRTLEEDRSLAHLKGKTFRVIDGQIFFVDPGLPPSATEIV